MKKSNIREFVQTMEEAKNPPGKVTFVCGEAQYHWRIGYLRVGETYTVRKDDFDGLMRDHPKVIRKVVDGAKSVEASEENKMQGRSPERK